MATSGSADSRSSRGATRSRDEQTPRRKKERKRPASETKSSKKMTAQPDPQHWEPWVDHLSTRKTPRSWALAVTGGKESPLSWALPATAGEATEWISGFHKLSHGKRCELGAAEARQWLSDCEAGEVDAEFAYRTLALASALPSLAQRLTADQWNETADALFELAQHAGGISLEEHPLERQLLGGELPLIIAYLFPELKRCRKLVRPAGRLLSEGICELLDGEGLPHCDFVPQLGPLLACWTRCQLVAEAAASAGKSSGFGKHLLSKDARLQYEWLVRQSLRLLRADRQYALGNGSPPMPSDLLRIALKLSGDPSDDSAAARLLGRSVVAKPKRNPPPEPSVYSEWAETAVMRCNWKPKSAHVAIAFGNRQLQLELALGKHVLFKGPWEAELTVDDNRLALADDYSEVCWFSDEDVDYLELEAPLDEGWKLQRHVLLAKRDEFLWLGDAVVPASPNDPPRAAAITYGGTLQLSDQFQWVPAEETLEGQLVNDKIEVLAIPLALPEWQAARPAGALLCQDQQFRLEQQGAGSGLFATLFFDLNRKRARKGITWRQLTVAENLAIQPAEVAVGYRVHSGSHQWLFYRSLAPPKQRTVFGQHLSSEMLAARFKTDGTVDTLIEIEGYQ